VRPHILDLHEEPYSLAAAAALWAAQREAPAAHVCIYSAQNIYKRYPPPFRQLERRVLTRAVAAYPCSREAGEVLRAKGFRGCLHVLPLGVSLPPELPAKNDGALRVGFVGRLEPYKGGEIAIEAFARTSTAVDATLEFVGSGSQESALRACAERLGLGSRVVFRGAIPQNDALDRIASYDALVVPSLTTAKWKEQFGRVAAQAMAAGTVVIASDSGALPDVVGDSGELVREGSVDDLADKLGCVLREPQRRADLARRGRKRAYEHLSWERVAEGCDEMYRNAFTSAAGGAPNRSKGGSCSTV
jgi:glycosyltransferase involved in cell wall biosynthesis